MYLPSKLKALSSNLNTGKNIYHLYFQTQDQAGLYSENMCPHSRKKKKKDQLWVAYGRGTKLKKGILFYKTEFYLFNLIIYLVSEYMSDPVLGMNPSPWRKLDVMTKNLN
jgi:hypothetical protein